ncbi:MAG: DNA helicase RecG, partial [Myxococcales bacterium]|nr:DNA helicase RecG [Myxococcales bacterium]
GLAQLHQLRGRVGRGRARSWCLLHTASAPGSLARARLEVLAATSDGFEVAERDLELRGPGEVFGTRQSGALGVDLHAGLVGAGVHEIVAAREAARALLREDPALARHPALREELASRRQRRVVYAAEAG